MKISSFASGFSALSTLLSLSFRALQANALGLTDTITWGGDNSRAGYQM